MSVSDREFAKQQCNDVLNEMKLGLEALKRIYDAYGNKVGLSFRKPDPLEEIGEAIMRLEELCLLL